MASTRVYILAKELGVKSSAIVAKCQDEGLEVKNHMSVIKAGLAATIKEWFSEGENVTTIETSKKVDLEKVRIKKKKKAKQKTPSKKAKDQKTEEIQSSIGETEETPTATIAEDEESQKTTETQEESPTTAVEPEIEIPKEPEPEPEPEPILPAGPILEKPEPAKLSGPQVVRVEAPEPIHKRPKPKSRAKYDAPITEPLMYTQQEKEDEGSDTSKGKKSTSKRRKDRTHGRRRDDLDLEADKKSKLVSKWRQKDIEERRARLDAAVGDRLRSRPVRKIAAKTKQKPQKARPAQVTISSPVTVKDLSSAVSATFAAARC